MYLLPEADLKIEELFFNVCPPIVVDLVTSINTIHIYGSIVGKYVLYVLLRQKEEENFLPQPLNIFKKFKMGKFMRKKNTNTAFQDNSQNVLSIVGPTRKK
jgi:hypothetical protein